MTAKLTPAMVTALTGATFSESRKGLAYSDADATHTGWTLKSGTNGRTLSAMRKRGLVMGDGGLTDAGVSAMAAQNGMGALTTPAPSPVTETAPVEPHTDAQTVSGGSVEIQGAEGFDMVPDMSALTGECFYGCGRPVTGMFCDYVGRTEGVCDLDRSKLGDHITVTPVDPSVWGGASDNVATVCVVQNRPGMNGRSHYHAPGCRDVAREMKHWGQRQSDVMEASFSDVAEILAFEYGDIASDSAESDTPEWWSEILHNATIDADMVNGFGVKVMPCLSIPAGRAGNGPLVTKDGFYRIGFDQPTPERVAEIRAEIDAHECNEAECITCIVRDMNREDGITSPVFQCYGENGAAVHVSPCAQADGINGPVCSIDDDGTDANDAGFVETMVTMEYELSVIVDDSTGATVSLGWVVLEMNSAQCMDWDRVADAYGAAHGTGTPRHGWASIITVHNACAL